MGSSGHARLGREQGLDAGPARAEVVESTAADQALVDPGQGGGGEVVDHRVPAPHRIRGDVELGRDQGAEGPRRRRADAPDGGEVPLPIELEALGGHLAVEVDRQLGHPEQGPVDAEEAGLDPVVDGHRDPPRQTEVAVEPAVDEGAAVDLDPELAPPRGAGVGAGLDPQAGAVGVGAHETQAGRGRPVGGQGPRHEEAVGDEVAAGRGARPVLEEVDRHRAARLEPAGRLGGGVVRGRGGVEVRQQVGDGDGHR